jgi:multidrug efflux pump
VELLVRALQEAPLAQFAPFRLRQKRHMRGGEFARRCDFNEGVCQAAADAFRQRAGGCKEPRAGHRCEWHCDLEFRVVISGSAITQVRDDIYLVDVIMRATDEQRISLETLRSIQVPLPNGRTVPLSQFASFAYDQEQPLVWRRDRIPTLTVQADVKTGVLPETVIDALAPSIAELSKALPRPYQIVVGGVVEDSAKAQASVIAVVPAMLLIMFTVLMVQLRSFARLFIVLSVGPLGLIGVVGALLLSGKPLGFVAILGILALLGMITKNAVILIGQIEAEQLQGKGVWQATVDASSTRFRPIMLTAISTVLGMIPIAPTVFWGPMAFAIMGGLLVGTILTLVFLPTLYVTWFRGKEIHPVG